jgi:ABC-type amino acid transport substrate-binding protein
MTGVCKRNSRQSGEKTIINERKTKKSLCVIAIAAALLCAMAGCRAKPAAPVANAPAQPVAQTASPVPAPAMSALSVEVNRVAGDSSTFREVRESGILRAAIECNRPPLCFRDKYGIARGLEVDLLHQTAMALGVKLNVASAGARAESPISGPVPARSFPSDPGLAPYFFSQKQGWLSFRIDGDSGFRKAVRLVIQHLYDTGTYQQLFANWNEKKDRHKPE